MIVWFLVLDGGFGEEYHHIEKWPEEFVNVSHLEGKSRLGLSVWFSLALSLSLSLSTHGSKVR